MEAIDYMKRPLQGIFALIYGASGTGKTHFAGTLGELGYTLVVDSDKGSRTLQTAKDLRPYAHNIVVTSFDKFADLDTLYKCVHDNDPKKWTQVLGIDIKKPFDWVVFDTWSEAQWFMHQEIRRLHGLGGTSNESLNFRKNLEIQHWGALTDLNKLAIEAFRGCTNINLLFTMQETLVKDEITGVVYGGPAIHGKLVQEIPSYFEIVIRTTTDIQGRWCATTLSKSRWPGKTRLGVGKDYNSPIAKEVFKIET